MNQERGAAREASPIKLEIRYHSAMPRWCKVDGLRVKAVHECEGGGFAIDKDQAEYLVQAYNAHDALVAALIAITERYVTLAGSGDCGFWDPETEAEVIAARTVLSSLAKPSPQGLSPDTSEDTNAP